MSTELTNDDLDELEVTLAQVEQTLRLLADEQVDPEQAVAWLDEAGSTASPSATDLAAASGSQGPDRLDPSEAVPHGTTPEAASLAEVVELPTRTVD